MTFTVREWAWLYVLGIFLFMAVIPAAEAAEQTILQRVVPFRTQGRVFGFAQSVELAASPISAFLIGPIAEFALIPYMESEEGRDSWRWLLGDGDARGIALVFMIAGAIMFVTVLIALASAPYRRLSRGLRRCAAAAARGRGHRLTVARVAQAGISGREEADGPVHRRDEGRPERVPVVVPLQRRRRRPPSSCARWVARAHGGGHVSSTRPCAMQHRLGDLARRPAARETPRQNSGSSSGRPCRPRKPACSCAEGRVRPLELGEVLPLQARDRRPADARGEQAGLGGERLDHDAAAHRAAEQRDPVGVDPHVVGVRQRMERGDHVGGVAEPDRLLDAGSSVDSAWLR